MCYLSVLTRRTRSSNIGAGVAAIAVLSVAALVTRSAAADWTEKTSVGVDLGLGGVITSYTPEARDGGSVFLGALRGAYDLGPDTSVALVLHHWVLPGSNHATMPGVGFRFEPYQGEIGRAFVDAALGPSWTSERWSAGFDLGAGFEVTLPVVAGMGIGPLLRYGQVINPASNSSSDGRAWSLGLSMTFRIGEWSKATAAERARTPAGGKPIRPFTFKVEDSDHDGVSDESDQCPEVAAGKHPDVFRPGCPENDEDSDGVPDSDDVCPATPAGDQPDRARRGCPFVDSDGDGVGDIDDHCPDKAGPKTQDPATNGCPPARKGAVRAAPEPEAPEAPPSAYKPVSKRRIRGPQPSPSSTPAPGPALAPTATPEP
jgi:hypothetical protein